MMNLKYNTQNKSESFNPDSTSSSTSCLGFSLLLHKGFGSGVLPSYCHTVNQKHGNSTIIYTQIQNPALSDNLITGHAMYSCIHNEFERNNGLAVPTIK